MIPKRIREAIETCEFPAEYVAAAMRQVQPILSFHVAGFTALRSVDEQMQKLALDSYIQGLIDGASPEVRCALDQNLSGSAAAGSAVRRPKQGDSAP